MQLSGYTAIIQNLTTFFFPFGGNPGSGIDAPPTRIKACGGETISQGYLEVATAPTGTESITVSLWVNGASVADLVLTAGQTIATWSGSLTFSAGDDIGIKYIGTTGLPHTPGKLQWSWN